MMKRVLSDAMRHHIEADNERLRAALRIIEDIGEGGNSIASLRNCARIARNALVSAAPVNPDLHHPAQQTSGKDNDHAQVPV
jgi:hypothetical protein